MQARLANPTCQATWHLYTFSHACTTHTVQHNTSQHKLTCSMFVIASKMTDTILVSLTTSRSQSGLRQPAWTMYAIWSVLPPAAILVTAHTASFWALYSPCVCVCVCVLCECVWKWTENVDVTCVIVNISLPHEMKLKKLLGLYLEGGESIDLALW